MPTLVDHTRETRGLSVVQSARVEADMDWEVHDIEGREVVDSEVHFWVVWEPTLVPLHALENAKELIAKFEARCEAQLELKRTKGRPVSEPGSRVTIVGDPLGKNPQKKRRGRPPKQSKQAEACL
jgi:hypothetical protein